MFREKNRKIELYLKQEPALPVEAELVNPEKLREKTVREILELPLLNGNRQVSLADYFEVVINDEGTESPQGEESKEEFSRTSLPLVILHGNLARFKRIGQGMSAGSMLVKGDVGFHAGAFMRGGRLIVEGNAGDYLGAHMLDGEICVRGSAGNFAGAAYRGYTQGMNGGHIFVEGDSGIMLGARMRRGLIAVQGSTGDMPGFALQAGTILIGRRPGSRAGAMMVRGTLVLLEPPEQLLPTFYYNCVYQPSFWRLFFKEMQKCGFNWPEGSQEAQFQRLTGDANEGGKGEILIWKRPDTPHRV